MRKKSRSHPEQLETTIIGKKKPEPPKPPKDREVHLGGFSRHKLD
jgi:hypothetical protein